MSYRRKLDEPGFMEGILEEIRNTPIEHYLEMLARYENEKPGDIILPGVPPRPKPRQGFELRQPGRSTHPVTSIPKKPHGKSRKAA